tara:strand:+ start:3513 stop:3989 length:477 start_codon:yes stop_codon:yes gene_type:complete
MSDVKSINIESKVPAGLTENFNLRYSDSARIRAILNSPKNIDFTNQDFPYSEFPDGLEIEFFDKNNQNTFIQSNYGIVYHLTKMVSLSGNVKIISSDGSSIESEQIYWDPVQEWLFTDKDVILSGDDYKIQANTLDADRSFKLLKTGQLNGNFLFDDN